MTRSRQQREAPGGIGGGRWRGWSAVAVAFVVAAALAFASPASGQEAGDGVLPPGDWTDEQRAELLDLLARTEAALPAFADPETLEGLGFINFGVTAPGGYDHWINYGWVDDEHILDPEFPESLVFQYTPSGGYELVAAMFFLPNGTTLDTIPEDVAWMPGWHQHPELCVFPDGTYAGLADVDGSCFAGEPSDMPPMMHVWLVDTGCGHRFGGVGVGGLDCDVDHEHPPTHPHDPTDPPTHPHDPTDPQHPTDPHDPGHPHDPSAIDPGTGGGHGHGSHPPAPVADPVHVHPDHAG